MGEAGGHFAIRERDGIRWIEVPLVGCVARFTLAFDTAGSPVDLDSAAQPASHESRLRVARALGLDTELIRIVRQVHGGRLVEVGSGRPDSSDPFLGPGPPSNEADGLLVRGGGETIAVQVADCLPVAIAGPGGRALLHCGWRGFGTEMLDRAAALVEGEEAVIGPSIGPCCYEVGPEVAEALGVERSPAGTVDLQAVARTRLRGAGVPRVFETGLCTCCEEERFFSHRRQGGGAGRQMAFLSEG
jgi:YfiH family protein